MPDSPILVLVAPQDIVNIASAVRIAKNFGIERMRLVKPEIFDAYRIEGIAHNTADLVERIEFFDSLEGALADVSFTAVLTGRERAPWVGRVAIGSGVDCGIDAPMQLGPGLARQEMRAERLENLSVPLGEVSLAPLATEQDRSLSSTSHPEREVQHVINAAGQEVLAIDCCFPVLPP